MSWNKKERRRFIRVEALVDVALKTSDGIVFQVNTVNLGAGGFKVFLEEELSPGSLLDVEFFLDKENVDCRGRVVWSVKQCGGNSGDILFDTGIEFYQIDEQEREKINRFIACLAAKGHC